MKCLCNKPAKKLTVAKDGANKGKEFYTCSNNRKCNFFKWVDDVNNYNPSRFKENTCDRCGRFNCKPDTCAEKTDFFGNKIP
jgi:ssDNA-binding Zn-finger/Zn-ribbon topoisomerase 1